MIRSFHIEPVRQYKSRADFGLAAFLGFGVIFWLYGVHSAGLAGAGTWGNSSVHVIRDGLLAVPLAFVAIRTGARLAEHWNIAAPSTRGLFGVAALIAITFALLLVPASAAHQFLSRPFDGTIHPHAFHGQPRTTGAGIMVIALHGLQDAVLSFVAALPVMFLSLVLLSVNNQNNGTEADTPCSPAPLTPARLMILTGIALAMIGAAIVALRVPSGKGPHGKPQGSFAHAPIVTDVTAGTSVDTDDLRITLQSAKWVRQPRLPEAFGVARASTDAAGELDRIYLEIALENLGSLPRSIGRGQFRTLAQNGTGWAPLADDFPAILLSPGETLTTRLIFELPSQATGLELEWLAGAAEARIPIADDDFGGLFGALCRALTKPWNG